jgi:hypothetical protein
MQEGSAGSTWREAERNGRFTGHFDPDQSGAIVGTSAYSPGTKSPSAHRTKPPPVSIPRSPLSFSMSAFESRDTPSAVATVLEIVNRLGAALRLIGLAEEAVPHMVAKGHTTDDVARRVMSQIPSLKADIVAQIEAAKVMLSSIQDRVEAVAQFLMLHRKALSATQSRDLDCWMTELRG